MKYVIMSFLFILVGCGNVVEPPQFVRGPDGMKAVIRETAHGATSSNEYAVDLMISDNSAAEEIFYARGGGSVNVKFLSQKLIVIEYCYSEKYNVITEIRNEKINDARKYTIVAVASVESTIGGVDFCVPKPEVEN